MQQGVLLVLFVCIPCTGQSAKTGAPTVTLDTPPLSPISNADIYGRCGLGMKPHWTRNKVELDITLNTTTLKVVQKLFVLSFFPRLLPGVF